MRSGREYESPRNGQLSLSALVGESPLVGASWTHPEHGRCVVESVVGDTARVQVDGPRSFAMVWPVALVQRELAVGRFVHDAPEPDEWVQSGADPGSFFNATENRRLAALGLVPLAPELAGTPSALPLRTAECSEARQSRQALTERTVMPVSAPKKPAAKGKKKSPISTLSKAKLRAYLLERVTIPDHAWNGAYGAPEREKGETREAYIRRVLA